MPAEPHRQRDSASVRAFLAATALAAGAALVVAIARSTSASLQPLALFAAAAVASELLYVRPDRRAADPTLQHQTIGFAAGVHLAAAVVLGPWQAALVACFGTLFSRPVRQASWRVTRFNVAMSTLAVLAAGFAFEACGGTPGALRLPADWPALVGLLSGFYATNDVLLALVLRLTSGGRYLRVLRDVLATGAPSYPGESGLAVVLAVLALRSPWAILALLPLVVAMYQGQSRLAVLRRETARALETFANVVDERDGSTFRHSERVADLVRELARAVGLGASAVARLAWTARLHDLGKIAVDAAVLRKPGRLSEEEWAAMRRHPRLSARILRRFRFAAAEARAVEYHHERYDGRGYFGVDGRSVPLAAHLLVVADSYDAMTSDRPYRRGLTAEAALAEIEANLGSQFHPAVAKAFVALRRGLDPLAVLTREERAELRALARADAGRRRRTASRLTRRLPDILLVAGAVAGLVGGGLSGAAVAAPGAAVAAAAVALRWRERSAGRALRLALGRAGTLDAVARAVDRDATLRWAGLVRWYEPTAADAIAAVWRGCSGRRPDESALVSWLLREVDAGSELVRTEEAELGGDRVYVAAPLAPPEGPAAYLVLGFEGAPPRWLDGALLDALPELERALAPEASGRTRAPLAVAS